MPAPQRTGAPAAAPLDLALVKTHLRVDGTAEDAYLERLIRSACFEVEERLQRTLITTPWRLRLDSFPEAIVLPMPRILSVTSVTYYDAAGIERTLNLGDTALDSDSEPGYLVPAPDKAWPDTQSGRINAVTIEYTAGYGATAADVPEPIAQWMLLRIGDLYAQRETVSVGNIVTEFKYADAMLDPYKIWSV